MSDSTFVFMYITQIVILIQTKYNGKKRYILIKVRTTCKYDTKISVWFYPFLKYKKQSLWFCIFPFIFFYSGNDVIHQLTMGRNSSLYVSITSTNKTISHTVYGQFSVFSEEQNYRLHIADYKNGSLGTVNCFFYSAHLLFNKIDTWFFHCCIVGGNMIKRLQKV